MTGAPASKGGRRGGKEDRLGVGEDQTSRRATGWSLPALPRVSSFSSAPLMPAKRVLAPPVLLSFSPGARLPSRSLALSLRNPLSHRRPSRAYIIHISTLMFLDYVVRRSTFPLIFLRPLPYERGPQQGPQCPAKLFDGTPRRPVYPAACLFAFSGRLCTYNFPVVIYPPISRKSSNVYDSCRARPLITSKSYCSLQRFLLRLDPRCSNTRALYYTANASVADGSENFALALNAQINETIWCKISWVREYRGGTGGLIEKKKSQDMKIQGPD